MTRIGRARFIFHRVVPGPMLFKRVHKLRHLIHFIPGSYYDSFAVGSLRNTLYLRFILFPGEAMFPRASNARRDTRHPSW